METLKPCPFCGNANVYHSTWRGFYYGDRGYSPKEEQFKCATENCCSFSVRGGGVTLTSAIRQWNTRVEVEKAVAVATAPLVEVLEEVSVTLDVGASLLDCSVGSDLEKMASKVEEALAAHKQRMEEK